MVREFSCQNSTIAGRSARSSAIYVLEKHLWIANFTPMKYLPPCAALFVMVLLAACASSSNQRITQNQALFNTYTPAEKKMIRTGQVAVGFDQDQVRMALGEPTIERTVSTAGGKSIVWEYREIHPSLGLSLGGTIGTGGRSGIGVGAASSVSPNRTKLLKRITFDRHTGEVSKIESF